MRIPPIIYVLFKNGRFLIGFTIMIIISVIGLLAPIIRPGDPTIPIGPANSPPSQQFPLGTDAIGRDILAMYVHGARVSIYIGVLTAVIAMAIGLPIATIAGIKGGAIDEALMGFTNIVMTIPSWIFAILVMSFVPQEKRGYEIISLVLGIFSWPWFSRALRAQLLSLKEREFVYLSKMAGYGDIRLAFEDLLPNIGSFIVSAFASFMSAGIGGEAALSIIFGAGPKHISLGALLYWSGVYQAYIYGYWWYFIPSGLTIVAIITSLQLIALGLEVVFNPRLRGI